MKLITFAVTAVILGFFLWSKPSSTMHPNGNGTPFAKNVLGTKLEICCTDPMTGFYRNGSCDTGFDDYGTHVVCAVMTEEFLDYTKSKGNDLCTARPEYNFPGLKAGDKWCLCAIRWKEALEAGIAPPVILKSTYQKALEFVSLDQLKQHKVR